MSRPNHAVVIVTTPAEFRPTHVTTLPPSFSDPQYYSRHLPLRAARDVAREFNKFHLPCNGAFDSRWALVIYAVKKRKRGYAATKGGAA